MALRSWARCLIAAAFLLAFANPIDLESCGPFIPSAVFVRSSKPENPEAFFSGQLGVLQPTYRRRYLAMAYRTMSGLPLSQQQIAALSKLPLDPGQVVVDSSAAEHWEYFRRQLGFLPQFQVKADRRGANYATYRNCNDDAFETAIATATERIRLSGASSPEVRDWVAAQDDVFWNCGNNEATIPDAAPPGSSSRIRTDRAYQIAAAHFYAGHYDDAKSLFQQIARDSDSPWRTLAPYLAARADLRKGDLRAAKTTLEKILDDPKLLSIHEKANALLGLVDTRIDPLGRLAVYSKRLLASDTSTLEQDLADFIFLYDKVTLAGMPETSDELVMWIEAMQGRGTEEQVIERWQRDRSVGWLVAALEFASKTTVQAPELITAGLGVPDNSPAWATARFHAVRLMIEMNRIADARKALTDVTPRMTSLSRSSQNAFLSEKMQTARTLDSFLAGAVRQPSGEVSDVEVEELDKDRRSLRLLGEDAARAFNFSLPLETWLQAAKQQRIPSDLRKHIAQTGFVRALLLKDPLAAQFAEVVAQLSPDDTADMRRFIAANGADDRFYEGLFWLLHRPGVAIKARGGLLRSEGDRQIDNFRDNWWNPDKDTAVPFIALVSAAQKRLANDEARRLAEAGSARFFLATQVLAWAESRPDDPRLAEALAMTIRMSHYSIWDPTADRLVERAFSILHQRFPGSSWAKQTPYWYK